MLHTDLSSVPISKMGQHLKKNEGRNGESALFDKMCQNFSLHTKILEHLEKQSTHPTYFSLFLNKYFKILINNSDCKQNSSARANGP